MRILVISTNVFSVPCQGYSGLEVIAYECAKGLAAKGHKVTLVAPRGSSCPGVEIHETTQNETERLSHTGYAHKLKDFDVVIDHSWQKYSYISKMNGHCPAPILGVCHSVIDTMYETAPPVPKPCLVGLSKNHSQTIKDHLKVDCRLCYNGVDLDFYKPSNLPRNDRYLFLARFSSIKGCHHAVNACVHTQKSLDLVGDTSITQEPGYLQNITNAVQQFSMYLRMIGPQTRSQCCTWFNTNKALIHPTFDWSEPFGLTIIEAAACGLPVIAAARGSLPELIADGTTGFVVKTFDELLSLLKEDRASSIKAQQCREWSANFSTQKMCDRYEELANEALESGGW